MVTVRRVRRIIRKIDPWTTLKVSAVVWAVVMLAVVLGFVIFWSVVDRAGIPDRITNFMIEITLIEEGSQPFANTEQFLRFLVFTAVTSWVMLTGGTVGLAIAYNLVSDVVGGLEVVVLEETLNPVPTQQQVLHPPTDYRANGGAVIPPTDQADIPTEESDPVGTNEPEPDSVENTEQESEPVAVTDQE